MKYSKHDDKNRLDEISILDETDKYISEYSADFTPKAVEGGFGKNRPYSEDFAECVIEYFRDPYFFFWKFPEKAKYINNIFHKYDIN